MPRTKKKSSLLTWAAAKKVRPLPRGEGESSSAQKDFQRLNLSQDSLAENGKADNSSGTDVISLRCAKLLSLPGERAGVRAEVAPNNSSLSDDFTIWQLIDSAFPTGGFAHSSGLEAAWQHGEVRGRTELVSF